jgi:hypothetical protein
MIKNHHIIFKEKKWVMSKNNTYVLYVNLTLIKDKFLLYYHVQISIYTIQVVFKIGFKINVHVLNVEQIFMIYA